MFDRHPGLIIQCSGTADVIDAVNLARTHDLLVAVRGGGHNVAGNSMCDDGLVIDLSRMRGVHVNRKSGTVRVQGGATWGDVDRETLAFGQVAPGGIVSETGVAGLTLSGGLGWVRNKYGLSCDNLVSAEVVLATGELVNANELENPDLLWALKGGGGNFGVVTSFEFRLHPLDPVVQVAVVFYPIEEGESILRQWRDWVVTTPAEVSSAFLSWTGPASEHLPPPVHGKSFVATGAAYAGPTATASVLEPLRHFGTPLAEIVAPLPFRMFQKAFDWAFPLDGSIRSYWKSLYVNELSDGRDRNDHRRNEEQDFTLFPPEHSTLWSLQSAMCRPTRPRSGPAVLPSWSVSMATGRKRPTMVRRTSLGCVKPGTSFSPIRTAVSISTS